VAALAAASQSLEEWLALPAAAGDNGRAKRDRWIATALHHCKYSVPRSRAAIDERLALSIVDRARAAAGCDTRRVLLLSRHTAAVLCRAPTGSSTHPETPAAAVFHTEPSRVPLPTEGAPDAKSDYYARALKNEAAVQPLRRTAIDADRRDRQPQPRCTARDRRHAHDQRESRVPFAALRRRSHGERLRRYLAPTDTGSVIAALSPGVRDHPQRARGAHQLQRPRIAARIPTARPASGWWTRPIPSPIRPDPTSLTLVHAHRRRLVKMSRLLGVQAPDAEAAVRQDLLAVIGTMIDAAIIDGTAQAASARCAAHRRDRLAERQRTCLERHSRDAPPRAVGKANERAPTGSPIRPPRRSWPAASAPRAAVTSWEQCDRWPAGDHHRHCPASTLLLIDLSAVVVAFCAAARSSRSIDTHFQERPFRRSGACQCGCPRSPIRPRPVRPPR